MIRKLLATTAFATLVASGAFAQETQPATTTEPAATGTMAPAAGAMMHNDGEHLASNIIGENVYNGAGSDAEKIGDVNDMVVGADGKIQSVIVGVGGFLGIGEKDVAINFSELKWSDADMNAAGAATNADGTTNTNGVAAANGDRWLVTTATKESLEALPAFDRTTFDVVPATTAMNNADGTTAAGTMAPAAPADGTAMNNNMAAAPSDTTAMAPATTTDTTQTAAIDRSTLTEVPADKLTAETLVGTTVYGANDANVGEIADIVLSQDGKVDAVLIDVGGFLGIGEKRIAVGMDKLSFMQDGNGNRYLYTTFSKEQLEGQTAYDADTYSADRTNQRLTVQ